MALYGCKQFFIHKLTFFASCIQRVAPFSSVSLISAKKEVNGVNLHYQLTGKGHHAVLLLPGALGCGKTDFDPQLKSLSKEQFTIVAWDPRGYGYSIPPERDFPSDFFDRDAADAMALMQALTFKKFSLLGWSDGGITALIAAARYPSLVRKLVVWGANAYVTEEDLKLYDAVRDVAAWSPKMRKPLEDLYGAENFAKTWVAWTEGINQFSKNPDGDICRGPLPLIKCPTLIIHGQKDPMVPQFHAEFLHKNIRGSRTSPTWRLTGTDRKDGIPMIVGVIVGKWVKLKDIYQKKACYNVLQILNLAPLVLGEVHIYGEPQGHIGGSLIFWKCDYT